MNSFVPQVIREFRKSFPLIAVTLAEGYSNDLIVRMRNSEIDIAFIRTTIANPDGFVVDLLQNEPDVVALPSGHVLARRKAHSDGALSLKDLVGENFFSFAGPHGALNMQGNALVAACQKAGFSPHVSPVASNSVSRLNLVAAGLGIAVVPSSVQRVNIDGVVFRRLKSPIPLRSPFNLVSRRGDASPVVRQFLKVAKRIAKSFYEIL